MNLYIIYFKDNTKFYGGDYKNTRWLEIPNKEIQGILYLTPLKKGIYLKDYDKYYHFIEATMDLNGQKQGQQNLEYSYLIGKKDDKYRIHKINLQTGEVEVKDVEENDKLIKQLNPIGWKG